MTLEEVGICLSTIDRLHGHAENIEIVQLQKTSENTIMIQSRSEKYDILTATTIDKNNKEEQKDE